MEQTEIYAFLLLLRLSVREWKTNFAMTQQEEKGRSESLYSQQETWCWQVLHHTDFSQERFENFLWPEMKLLEFLNCFSLALLYEGIIQCFF